MSDLLVKLYELPELEPTLKRLPDGVRVQRARAPERNAVLDWVNREFGEGWQSETAMAFSEHPIRCFLALDQASEIVGFVAYDVTFRGFLGPIGVAEQGRGKGVGTALLLRALHALHEDGFAYGIIGWSSNDEYYARVVGAVPIEGSEPGPYGDGLSRP